MKCLNDVTHFEVVYHLARNELEMVLIGLSSGIEASVLARCFDYSTINRSDKSWGKRAKYSTVCTNRFEIMLGPPALSIRNF